MNDSSIILGIRILIQIPNSRYDYRIEHEFSGENWKLRAIYVLPLFLDKIDIKFQTLHSFSSSYNLQSRTLSDPSFVWFDNNLFKFEDLISYE